MLLDIPQAIRVNVEKVYSITAMIKGLGQGLGPIATINPNINEIETS